jgi:hypothetical protein
MGVPGKSRAVVFGAVVAKIIEQQKRIEFGRISKSEELLFARKRSLPI